ncbi:heterokaryon incompatibility protein-domain-containing protein, partial [Xylaria castorea]
MERNGPSLELTADVSGLTFEAFYLACLLRKSVTASVRNWLEHTNRGASPGEEIERLESAWIICIEFFTKRFNAALQNTLHQNIQCRQLVLPTKCQQPLLTNVSHEIILLDLQPSLDPTKPIKCIRRVSSLEQQPGTVYDVLSYAWDSPHETKRILINGSPFKIHKSLESALRHLRLPSTSRMLWVDSLCVTGRDVQGWSHDLKRLTFIYAEAREVIGWLGNESNTSSLAFSFLQLFAALPDEQRGALSIAFRKKLSLGFLDAIRNLMCRPWWDYAGLLQELMSGCQVMIWCGTESVSWDVFHLFFQILHQQSLDISREYAQSRSLPILHLIPTGSIGYFPSLQRYAPGKELPGIIEALFSGLERTFARSNLATAWTLALNRIGAYFGPFLTHIALRICRDDVENRQAGISKVLNTPQIDSRVGVRDGLANKTGQHCLDDRASLLNTFKEMDSKFAQLLAGELRQTQHDSELHMPSKKYQVGLEEAFECWTAILKIFEINRTTNEEVSSQETITSHPSQKNQAGMEIPTLLWLCPSENPGSDILCNSVPVDIVALSALGVENSPHCALSHLWIDRKPMDTISLDGKQTRVTSNLSAILRSLRRIGLPVLLWTNVNANDQDQQSQVGDIKMTRSMYSMAGHVFICGDEHSASHFDLSTTEQDVISHMLQILGSPQRHFAEKRPIGLPVIMPSNKPEVDAKNDVKCYPYQVLPTRTSIRLLAVLPLEKAETEDDKYSLIRCSMSRVDLEDSPEYDALSYTWGDPLGMYNNPQEIMPQSQWYTRSFEIECDGKLISISANLFTALISIRWIASVRDEPDFKEKTKDTPQMLHLWIDAICINQADLDERNQQVGLMNRIYRQARAVVVWLGGEDDPTQDAMQILCLLAEKSLQGREVFEHIRSSGMNILDESTYRVLGFPRINMRQWIALYAFLSRSWFTRAWIVQEVCLAQKIVLLCGLRMMSSGLLISTVDVLRRSGWGSQLSRVGEMAILSEDSAVTIPSAVRGLHRSQLSSGLNLPIFFSIFDVKASLGMSNGYATSKPGVEPYRLVTNATLFRDAQAMDPRDKIYAFMSISREFMGDQLTSEIPTLSPNYRLSPREVFIESATFMLLSSPALELLSLVQDAEKANIQDLPSWVPDFSVRNLPLPLDFGFPSPFTAADGLGPVYRVFPSADVLEVRGICIKTLASVYTFESTILLSKLADILSQVPPLSAISRPRMNEGLRQFILESERYDERDNRTFLLQAADSNCTIEHQTRFEVLWRTMLADSSRGRHPLPADFGMAMRAAFREIVKDLQLEVRDVVVKRQPDAAEHLDNLAREYTAFQKLLSQAPEDASLSLPPEFKHFMNAFQSSKNISPSIAKQEHDRMLKRSTEIVDDSLLQDVRRNGFDLGMRSLFRTSVGQLGRGAKATKAGDEAWVLAGGNVPFTLRKVSEGRYKLIGECYIHGVMHGEAVANVSELCRTIRI